MNAHDLLGISLDDLKKIDNDRIKKAYDQKMRELDDIRVIEVDVLKQKETELKNAFELLQTSENRVSYLKGLNQPALVMNTVKTKAAISVIPIETTVQNINISVHTYQNYIDEKIKKLDQTDPTYNKTKENLESHKKNAAPNEKNYSTFDDFQKSEFYQAMSKDEQKSYSKSHFPKKVITITLTFDSFEEATQYIKKNDGIEKAREFVAKVQQKGFKIDPKVLAELKPQPAETTHRLGRF